MKSLPKAHETELNAGLFNTYTFWVTTSSNISITGKDRFSVYDLLDMSNETYKGLPKLPMAKFSIDPKSDPPIAIDLASIEKLLTGKNVEKYP